jgi:hypothetical protein
MAGSGNSPNRQLVFDDVSEDDDFSAQRKVDDDPSELSVQLPGD